MKHWRVIAGAAVLAALLSALAGVIGGVAIGAILVRVLVAALVFAGLGYGAVYLLEKYVPEVLTLGAPMARSGTPTSSGEAADEQGEGGSHLDITLPEENPHATGGTLTDVGSDDGGLETLPEAPTAAEPTDSVEPSEAADDAIEDLDSPLATEVDDQAGGMPDAQDGTTAQDADAASAAGDGIEALEAVDAEADPPATGSDDLGDISSAELDASPESGAAESEYGSAQDIASAIRTALSRSE